MLLLVYTLVEAPEAGWFSARTLGSFLVPASWFQSIQPLAIILLAPVMAWLWRALARRTCADRDDRLGGACPQGRHGARGVLGRQCS